MCTFVVGFGQTKKKRKRERKKKRRKKKRYQNSMDFYLVSIRRFDEDENL